MKRNPVALALAALLAVALLAPAVRAEERANVAEQLKWNTADLYASEDAWYQAKDDIAARIPKLAEFQGRLGESADVFYQALSSMMALDQDFTRLYVYASMRLDEDTRIGKPREMTQIAQQLAVQYYATLSYVRPELLALGAEKVNGFVAAEPRLAPYRHVPRRHPALRPAHADRGRGEDRLARPAIMAGHRRRRLPRSSPTPTCPTPRSRSRAARRSASTPRPTPSTAPARNRADRDRSSRRSGAVTASSSAPWAPRSTRR